MSVYSQQCATGQHLSNEEIRQQYKIKERIIEEKIMRLQLCIDTLERTNEK
ncbi:hypothetical protein LOAG_10936 [Loa loa]|uniref:Uncharacterized protein n=1 Tax=Loa loa TaxID=7209 RepID=A0A1S0TNZ7_LOALO|nr:hypothetical protein LOAG_10936 [Loa loa]EFO17562.1 hypothetical protein LOAG_10936 [Loa loa]